MGNTSYLQEMRLLTERGENGLGFIWTYIDLYQLGLYTVGQHAGLGCVRDIAYPKLFRTFRTWSKCAGMLYLSMSNLCLKSQIKTSLVLNCSKNDSWPQIEQFIGTVARKKRILLRDFELAFLYFSENLIFCFSLCRLLNGRWGDKLVYSSFIENKL